ncbi:MAG: hypothetical protein NT036_00445 [Candidatus Omnitrophica bacterium]|nr:hypothetical protein [Candidatus Omnitrophota bacterium]
MVRRIAILVFLVFFASGAIAATSVSGAAKRKNNITQSIYNWLGTWDKLCVNRSERCCKACEIKCCEDCNIDCGGTCCSKCVKK